MANVLSSNAIGPQMNTDERRWGHRMTVIQRSINVVQWPTLATEIAFPTQFLLLLPGVYLC